MIKELKDKFKDSSIAILGSGPSLTHYNESEDIAIATNGASRINKNYDIFIAGDEQSANRNWWQSTTEAQNSDKILRIIASFLVPFDPIVYPDKNQLEMLQNEYHKFIKESQKVNSHRLYAPSIRPKKHMYFRFGGKGIEFVNLINPNQELTFWGGTISAIGVQLALIMGAKEINLYGCGFNNYSGNYYFYNSPIGQKGKTDNRQKGIMQATIDHVIDNYDVNINIIGDSELIPRRKNLKQMVNSLN